jgi:uncharacterized membrane protein YuzA (DUF378 family)
MIMKVFRLIAAALLPATILMGLWQGDSRAAWFGDEMPVVDRIVYVLIGVAVVIAVIAVFNDKLLTRILGRLGHSSGGERGPNPGDGAVIHHSSGEADFDGSPGNALPPNKDANRDLPYPPKKSAD